MEERLKNRTEMMCSNQSIDANVDQNYQCYIDNELYYLYIRFGIRLTIK